MQFPPVPQKRPSNEEEENPGASRKKPRTSRVKADGPTGEYLDFPKREFLPQTHPVPKRGYTAKKRSEAAQIAAQNGQHLSVPVVITG